MPMDADSSMLMVALLALLAGLAIGLVIAWLTFPRARSMRQTRQELDQAREEFDDFRHQVNDHFAQTSSLFREMTEKYREVYDHLSEGAQELCTRELPKVALDQAERRLPLAAPSAESDDRPAPGEGARSTSDAPEASEQNVTGAAAGTAGGGDGTDAEGEKSADTAKPEQEKAGTESGAAAGGERRDQAASR